MTRYLCRACGSVMGEEGVDDGATTREDPDFDEVEAGLCDPCYQKAEDAFRLREREAATGEGP